MPTRRNLFKSLASLPFIGAMFGKEVKEEKQYFEVKQGKNSVSNEMVVKVDGITFDMHGQIVSIIVSN